MKKYIFPNSFLGTAPMLARPSHSGFIDVERLKALVYSVAIEMEETLHQRVLMTVRPFATDLGAMKLYDSS
jgi:hypothetical protein